MQRTPSAVCSTCTSSALRRPQRSCRPSRRATRRRLVSMQNSRCSCWRTKCDARSFRPASSACVDWKSARVLSTANSTCLTGSASSATASARRCKPWTPSVALSKARRPAPSSAIGWRGRSVETAGNDPDRARKVEVVPYDAAWPQLFAAQEAKILAALGADALLIEHVGSTSVPGLAAKPVIDVQLAVRDSADEAAYRSELERAGY